MSLQMDPEYRNPPTTETAIKDFAEVRKLSLPKSYIEFLLQFNGGRPTTPNFPVSGYPNAPTWDVRTLLGIGTTHETTELAYNFDLYEGGFPTGIIPIAIDDGINYVCLDLRNGADRVAFWDKRHFWGTGEWRESDLYHVADSFDAFLESLKPSPY